MNPRSPLILYNATRNCAVGQDITLACSPWQRLRGLLFRRELQPGSGMLLLPSRGIHTFFMCHAIDVVFLDSLLRVERVCHAVAPWQVRLPTKNTHCVVELRKHEARRIGLAAGDALQFQGDGGPFGLAQLRQEGAVPSRYALKPWLGLLLVLLLAVQAGLAWSARKASAEGRVDLRAYYAAGTAVRLNGPGGLYDAAVEQHTQQALFHDGWRTLHFLYPPFAVLPYAALAGVPYRLAFVLVSLGSLVCLGLSAILLARTRPDTAVSPLLMALCALCAFPSVIALTQGQLSFFLLLLLTGVYCLERRGLQVPAGLCLALGMVKVQVVLPIAVLYLLWRRYRVVAGFAMGTALLAALSVAVAGVAGVRDYAARLLQVSTVTLSDGAAALVQYGVHTTTEPNLHGLAVWLLGDGTPSALLTLLLSIAVLVWSVRQPASIGTAVCAALLLSYHLLPYDLVLLLLPFALEAMDVLPDAAAWQWRTVQRYPLLWLLLVSALLLSAPVAAVLMLHNGMIWYVVAPLALLFASGARKGQVMPSSPPLATTLTSQPVHVSA